MGSIVMISAARRKQAEAPAVVHQPPKARRVSRVPENETKEERFKRLALQRVPKALKAIRAVEKLSAPTYAYNTAQVDRITTALGEALTELMQAFKGRKAEGEPFDL